ncbi:MAG: AAA family ATPase, partial [Candidatus Nanopelagicales bacterium]
PPGYVGYEQGGQLTEAVRRRPYSVILLDEVEKAHPEVFDVLLQVLDDGRLTDGQGRTVDFRNSIMILTSNMGSQFLIDTDVPFDERKDQVLTVVRQQFRPEFLNRLDAMVMFNPLDREELMRIARIQIEQLQRRLDERRISIELTEDAQQWLVNTGFDPIYGARPLRRLVQTAVGDKLAVAILSGDVKDGDSVTVGADPDGSGLILQA